MVEKKDVDLFYLVHLSKTNSKDAGRCFVCVKRRGDEISSSTYFHGIGYFCSDNCNFDFNGSEEKEVWIPCNKIDFIESLIYRPR